MHTLPQQRRLWPFLAVADTLIALVVVANLVTCFWTGSWFILDLYFFPEDEVTSAWLCYVIGNTLMAILTLMQFVIRKYLLTSADTKTWRNLLTYKLYTYFVGWSVVFQWRGIAYVSVLLTGMSVESAAIGLVVASVGLCLLRNYLGTITPPLTMALDAEVDDYYLIGTRFSSKPSFKAKFIFDALFTTFVINTLVAFVLKGYWIILEVYMPADMGDPDDLIHVSMTSFLIFFGVAILPIIGQYELMRVNKRLEKKSNVCKIILQEVFLVIFSPLPMLYWRGAYLLHASFVQPQYYGLYAWVSHFIGFIGVNVMMTSSSILPVGCVVDTHAFDSPYGVFDYRYVRAFLSKRKYQQKRNAGEIEKSGELNKELKTDHDEEVKNTL